VQLILRRCGCGVAERSGANGGAWALSANPASHLAAHHAAFSTSAFCKVQLILRSGGSEAELEAWQALHLSLTFSCGHIAAHHANF